MTSIRIIEATKYTDAVLTALNRLLPQLLSSALPLSAEDLRAIARSGSSHLFLAEIGGEYCGTLTVTTYRIPTGFQARIDDVVVDGKHRGTGIGRALLEHALGKAKELGAVTVDLTSRPYREAANALYLKMGFELRDTNVYRYTYT